LHQLEGVKKQKENYQPYAPSGVCAKGESESAFSYVSAQENENGAGQPSQNRPHPPKGQDEIGFPSWLALPRHRLLALPRHRLLVLLRSSSRQGRTAHIPRKGRTSLVGTSLNMALAFPGSLVFFTLCATMSVTR
jgi:hypothetical protein